MTVRGGFFMHLFSAKYSENSSFEKSVSDTKSMGVSDTRVSDTRNMFQHSAGAGLLNHETEKKGGSLIVSPHSTPP